jgi:hypothetical protein
MGTQNPLGDGRQGDPDDGSGIRPDALKRHRASAQNIGARTPLVGCSRRAQNVTSGMFAWRASTPAVGPLGPRNQPALWDTPNVS